MNKPARILIVEDEAYLRRVLTRTLEGYEVVQAANGREALARIGTPGEFGLVLCDLMMPGLSGIELYERVREAAPGQEAAFVFITGGVFTDKARLFLDQVPNLVLHKPFDCNKLLDLVAEMVAPAPKAAAL